MKQVDPYAKMKENAIMTAPKEELTLMLYDGAIKFIKQTEIALEANDVAKAHDTIVRVQNIIREFQLTLDKSYPVSKDLNAMYDYIYRRLVEANINKDPAIIKECGQIIRSMRDTWKEAIQISRGGPGQAKAGTPISTGKSLQA